MNRENRLIRTLSKYRIQKLSDKINSFEISKVADCIKQKMLVSVRDQSTEAGMLGDNIRGRFFSRTMSADQMLLLTMEENGPKEGYINRGVLTETPNLIKKKDIFQIIEHFEDKFKTTIDYDNLVITRAKPKEQKLTIKTLIMNEELMPNKLESAKYFSFTEYGKKILEDYKKYVYF